MKVCDARFPWLVSFIIVVSCIASRSVMADDTRADDRPNILFISIDDLNDWIGCMGGHPQARTPNIDRLAQNGMLFTNAHCPSPSCNPSRTAIMTGIPCYRSGLYDNRQRMRNKLPDAELIPKYFSRNGYWSAGSGKLLHYFIDADSWDQYYPAKETENPFPPTLYPEKRPVSLPRGGNWQYIETDWGPLDVTDQEFGGDWLVSKWVGEQLSRKHDKPFFLACGIYRPHEPWFVPKKYFDQFPLADIKLPPGYLKDDLDDVPPAGQSIRPRRYFPHIQKHDQWKQGVQGYLASIAFADAMVGRVLKALDEGPNGDNTIVVLWSDHGWHLGEKENWQKYTAWRVCSRVPLIFKVPKGLKNCPGGTAAGSKCDQPVSLASLYSTLTELAGLPDKPGQTEPSLVPLLNNPKSEWPHLAITHLDKPKNYGVSGQRFRYIHYANGEEELYDIKSDPFEWTNLAAKPKHAKTLERLKRGAPAKFAEFVPAKMTSLAKLTWTPASGAKLPDSKPSGEKFDIFFNNKSGQPVIIYRIGEDGTRHGYGTLETGWFKPYATRRGEIWLVTDKSEKPLGHFAATEQEAQAIIPSQTQ